MFFIPLDSNWKIITLLVWLINNPNLNGFWAANAL